MEAAPPSDAELDGPGEDAGGGCSGNLLDAAGLTSWTANLTGASLTVLASGQNYPFSIAVDSASVYWTNFQSGVMKVSVDGGVVNTLSLGRTGAGIAVDSRNVYWTDTSVCPPGQSCPPYSGEIQGIPLDSGAPTTLAFPSAQPNFVAVDATSVYWSAPSGLQKVAIAGGTPVSLWSTPMPLTPSDMVGSPYTIAVANGLLFAAFNPNGNTTGGTSDGSIESISVNGGTPLTIYSAPNAWITSIAADSDNIYWTNYGSSEPNNTDGVVMKVPIGGSPITMASGQHDPAAIALDGSNVYWANAGTQSAGYLDGSIMKAPLDGGTPVTLAAGGGGVYGIAVDATSVYWTTQNDSVMGYTCRGRVVKLTPK